jgi:SAM-dependent methyltransferase
MGLDAQALLFLKSVYDTSGSFGRTATIGRQAVHVPSPIAAELLGFPIDFEWGTFCEFMLTQHFGSSVVHSFDNSDYEGASHIFDLNDPVPTQFYNQYDTIIDSGSLEHIYDIRTALQSIARMMRPGGQVIHINPSNNFCGHGFYQFSPEFYFSTYSASRGFASLEVFLAKVSDSRKWFRVRKPEGGERAEVSSGLPLVCLVRAQKQSNDTSNTSVQQSDYVHHWSADASVKSFTVGLKASKVKEMLRENRQVHAILMRLYFSFVNSTPFQTYLHRWRAGYHGRNKWLTKVPTKRRI